MSKLPLTLAAIGRPKVVACVHAVRSSQRGAAMVEALIVISLLSLGFMAMLLFRDFYVKSLIAARLARGSVLAYSMTGCGDRNEPAQWIGQRDLVKLTAARPGSEKRPASDPTKMESTSGSGQETSDVMANVQKMGGLSGDGKGIMNPIASSTLSGRVRITTKDGTFAPERTVFDRQVGARSFASCADPVRQGDFKAAVDYIRDIFVK